jgi:uncharacterized protein YbbK (DUF523 family)
MEYLLVSACLLGINTKYNGKNNYIDKINKLKDKYTIIKCCPEVDGGLSIPRSPSEVIGEKVINKEGIDVTKEYIKGAFIALNLCKKYNISKALLKEKSPSCGKMRYDGTFSGTLINKSGITTKLLQENNIEVYSENEIDKLL